MARTRSLTIPPPPDTDCLGTTRDSVCYLVKCRKAWEQVRIMDWDQITIVEANIYYELPRVKERGWRDG